MFAAKSAQSQIWRIILLIYFKMNAFVCVRVSTQTHTAQHMTLVVAIFFHSAFMSWIKWLASTTSTTDVFIQRKFESFTAFELQAELGFFAHSLPLQLGSMVSLNCSRLNFFFRLLSHKYLHRLWFNWKLFVCVCAWCQCNVHCVYNY